ncbi:MAG: 50S ribosomal protein L24 [Pseudomonadota bacterium]|nr:50S ribosomal protein L24 [Pseudomonadota bacterium]
MAARIRKNDRVVVLTGKDRGKTGEVLQVLPKEDRVVVKGVALVKRHQKATPARQAGVVEKEASIHISNVAFADPKTGKPTRIGFRILEDGRKVRVAKSSGEIIE